MRKFISLFAVLSLAVSALSSCAGLPLEEHIDYDADWTLLIESVTGERENITIKNSDKTSSLVRKGNSLYYGNVGGKEINVTVTYSASKQVKGALEISTIIENNEKEWMVKVWRHPSLKGFKAGLEDDFILPVGSGFRFPVKFLSKEPENGAKPPKYWSWDEKRHEYVWRASYPSKYASMQWGVLQGKESCLYVACHDEDFSSKDMTASYSPLSSEVTFTFVHQMTCMPGETVHIVPTLVHACRGSWYEAADLYREWFTAHSNKTEKPEWVRNCSGWLLAILKQQNDEVIVPYDQIGGMLADAAIERGIDVLGLFGRGIGGHDRYYPDYSPDPKLGGEKALRDGIAKAKEKGVRVVLYTNGQLLDQDCSWFWPEVGKNITVQKKNGKLETQTWHKYHDAPARVLGLACHSCDEWRQMMLQFAMDANDLGADGLLYDQLACTAPKFCYSPDHGHPVPTITYGADMLDNLVWVRQKMKEVNPDFIVMTEGISDVQTDFVDMFHGSRPAIELPDKKAFISGHDGENPCVNFPEMFRYTFSDAALIARLRSPAHSRYSLNYGLYYGTRNEMELRYAGDRKYVQDNEFPTAEDYANVTGAPDLNQIRQAGDPVESERYYRQVLTFQKKYADLLMNGRFLGGNGLKLEASSQYVMANAFEAPDGRLGILVWNVSDIPVTYNVSYPGYTVKSISAPDKDDLKPGDVLAEESVHLVIFDK